MRLFFNFTVLSSFHLYLQHWYPITNFTALSFLYSLLQHWVSLLGSVDQWGTLHPNGGSRRGPLPADWEGSGHLTRRLSGKGMHWKQLIYTNIKLFFELWENYTPEIICVHLEFTKINFNLISYKQSSWYQISLWYNFNKMRGMKLTFL